MKKLILGTLAVLLVGALVFFLLSRDRIARVQMVSSLFTGAEQFDNFPRTHELFPVAEMPPAPRPMPFVTGAPIALPETFEFAGGTVDAASFLTETDTAALLVVQAGELVLEDYWLTGGRDVTWLSMSVAKSFVSALIGIAVNEGFITSVEDPVTQYVPELAGSAYEGVRIKDILQMSSGARWNEDYSDPKSDINRFGRIFALGGSLNSFAATLPGELEAGTFNRYNSTDTQVLGWLLVEATARPIFDYMTEKLWHPLGAESVGYWLLDGEQMEMAFGGLNITARDYAKGGLWRGKRLISEEWVTASVTPDAPHLLPGDNAASDYGLGYAYQWWIPAGDEGEFMAIGVYNQFVYVNPTTETVIVKLSANSEYGVTDAESSIREFESIEFLRSIVDVVRPKPSSGEGLDLDGTGEQTPTQR